MKTYKIKPTKKQMKILRLYWAMFKAEQDILWGRMGDLERAMSKATKIKDLEFFMVDNDWVGIGQYDRKMALIQREKLE